MFSVDVDEADVAVLTQNLTRLTELFTDINKSLRTISSKTLTASRSIKPGLAEFNTLTQKKQSVQDALSLLLEVSIYSSRAAPLQKTLSSPIREVGVNKFISSLGEASKLVKEMKSNIKDFDGVVVGFANTVDKAELAVVGHFGAVLTSVDLDSVTPAVKSEVAAIMNYFAKTNQIESAHNTMERSFGRMLETRLAKLEKASTLEKRAPNAPHEKGQMPFTKYCESFGIISQQLAHLCEQFNIQDLHIFDRVLLTYLDQHFLAVLSGFANFLRTNSSSLITYDVVILEILDALLALFVVFSSLGFDISMAPTADREYTRFVDQALRLLVEWVRLVENRVNLTEKCTDHTIPEIVVEVLSKLRRIAESGAVTQLISGCKPGSWLEVDPPLRFISVYTSVIAGSAPTEGDQSAFLVSSYLSDIVDELMVNIEMRLRDQGELRKSTQGFMLVKNLVMVETIINRLEPLYQKLGSNGLERLLRLKNRFLKLFLDDWNYASYIIIRDMTQITTTNAMHGGLNSTKEKDQIKDLFKNFNESFEEALRQYEKFNIQEKVLRQYLSNEIKKLILNAYNKLYDKFGNSDFTKNRAKYVKYDKATFERVLNERL